jgi:hypothetical protein
MKLQVSVLKGFPMDKFFNLYFRGHEHKKLFLSRSGLFYGTLNIWTMQCQMIGWLTNDKSERIWKEAVMA